MRSESVPAIEVSWAAAREAERLRSIALSLLAEPGIEGDAYEVNSASESLERLEDALTTASSVPELVPPAQAVQDAAYGLTEVIDNLAVYRNALIEANAAAADLQQGMDALSVDDRASQISLVVLSRAMLASNEDALQRLWDEFTGLHAAGIDPTIVSLADGQGVFAARGQQLVLKEKEAELSASFSDSRAALETSVSALLSGAGDQSTSSLGLAVSTFDQGRLLLTLISVVSVIAATLAAWLWVGNGMVRRLSRMSERMRSMAGGDLETPVPEVGEDEIGELANALEVFRERALEVQRLNLVE